MNATAWSFIAAFVAVGCEYLYRTLPGTWWQYLPLWCLTGLTVSFAIHKLVTQPDTPLIGALVMWSFAVIASRVFVTVVLLQDRVSPGTWCALALMITARIVQGTWR